MLSTFKNNFFNYLRINADLDASLAEQIISAAFLQLYFAIPLSWNSLHADVSE